MTKDPNIPKKRLRLDPERQLLLYRNHVKLAAELPAEEHIMPEVVAALWLRLRPRGLQNMRFQGRGPRHINIGRRVCYRRSDLKAWISENTVETRAVA